MQGLARLRRRKNAAMRSVRFRQGLENRFAGAREFLELRHIRREPARRQAAPPRLADEKGKRPAGSRPRLERAAGRVQGHVEPVPARVGGSVGPQRFGQCFSTHVCAGPQCEVCDESRRRAPAELHPAIPEEDLEFPKQPHPEVVSRIPGDSRQCRFGGAVSDIGLQGVGK